MTDQTNDDAVVSGETAAARFKRIANPRLATAQTAINALSKCSSKDYEYSQEQIDIMEKILLQSVESCIMKFRNKGQVESMMVL